MPRRAHTSSGTLPMACPKCCLLTAFCRMYRPSGPMAKNSKGRHSIASLRMALLFANSSSARLSSVMSAITVTWPVTSPFSFRK